MIIQMGRLEGRLKASNTPVMMAEPSVMVVVSFFTVSYTHLHISIYDLIIYDLRLKLLLLAADLPLTI